MYQDVSIIGGDLRNAFLSQMLWNKNRKIFVYGFENEKSITQNNNIIKCNSLEEAINSTEIIISSIPFTKDKVKINMPLSVYEIEIEDFIKKIKNKTLIVGNIDSDFINKAEKNNVKVIDLMKMEELVIYNTIATAEGTIRIAIEETNKTIYDSNILILGFGRVGKTLAERFYGLKANVYCEARKDEDIAWINTYGYKSLWLSELDDSLEKFDIIINTIPEKILDENRLKLIKKECLIIDLASNPGGVDFEKAQELEIKTIHALGLPGKIAPYTSAKFINEIIEKII
ncbi:MAG: dipicolinate synthase subunit DpsA [Clostridia bacterium]|nr:dipicolinate synthase subunit DpsA [Clostridia bacterium]